MAGDNVLDAKMTLENSGFVSAMNKGRESTMKALEVMKAVTLGVTGLAGAFAAFRSVEGVIEGVMGAFERGRQLMDLSRQTTTNVRDLVILQQAFRDTGASADSVGHTVFMLQKALGGVSEAGEPTATVFQKIGLSIGALKKMDTVSQFQAIAKGLSGLNDPSEQSAAAMKIFGRSALEVMGLLRDPAAFGKAVQDVGGMANVLARNADAFDRVSKSIELIKTNVGGLFDGVASGLAPEIEKITTSINRINFTGIGEKIGAVMSTLLEAFQEGKLSSVVELGLTIGFKKAVNAFTGMMTAASSAFDSAVKDMFDSNFFQGIKAGFVGVAAAFASKLLDFLPALHKSLESIADSFSAWMQNLTPEQYEKKKQAAKQLQDDRDLKAYLQKNDAAYNPRIPFPDRPIDKMINDRHAGIDTQYFDKSQGKLQMLSQVQRAGDVDTLAGATKSQWDQASSAALAQSTQLLSTSLPKILAVITKAMTDYKTGNVLDASKNSADLKALIASLKLPAPGDGSTPDNAAAAGKGGLGRTGAYKEPAADRLSRIGLFVGGAPAAPGLNEAKRTAAATEKASGTLKQILIHFSNGSTRSDLVYAE